MIHDQVKYSSSWEDYKGNKYVNRQLNNKDKFLLKIDFLNVGPLEESIQLTIMTPLQQSS